MQKFLKGQCRVLHGFFKHSTFVSRWSSFLGRVAGVCGFVLRGFCRAFGLFHGFCTISYFNRVKFCTVQFRTMLKIMVVVA